MVKSIKEDLICLLTFKDSKQRRKIFLIPKGNSHLLKSTQTETAIHAAHGKTRCWLFIASKFIPPAARLPERIRRRAQNPQLRHGLLPRLQAHPSLALSLRFPSPRCLPSRLRLRSRRLPSPGRAILSIHNQIRRLPPRASAGVRPARQSAQPEEPNPAGRERPSAPRRPGGDARPWPARKGKRVPPPCPPSRTVRRRAPHGPQPRGGGAFREGQRGSRRPSARAEPAPRATGEGLQRGVRGLLRAVDGRGSGRAAQGQRSPAGPGEARRRSRVPARLRRARQFSDRAILNVRCGGNPARGRRQNNSRAEPRLSASNSRESGLRSAGPLAPQEAERGHPRGRRFRSERQHPPHQRCAGKQNAARSSSSQSPWAISTQRKTFPRLMGKTS